MGGVFRIVDKDGNVTFSDRPAGAAGASAQPWKPGAPGKPDPKAAPKSKAEADYDTARQDIALARKHVPNLAQYLDYLDYLRHHSPIRFDRLMQQLQHDDPQVWLELQKYPQFQPLGRTLGIAKAGEGRLALAAGVVTGNYGGSIAKWAESTLKDLMKRDGYYADVLGAKATTLPQPPRRTYSTSRLGRYLATEAPRQEAAATAAAKELQKGREALRSGAATAFSRVGGSILDVEIAALDPDNLHTAGVIMLRRRIDALVDKGVISSDDEQPQRLLSQGRYVELKKYLDDAQSQFLKGER